MNRFGILLLFLVALLDSCKEDDPAVVNPPNPVTSFISVQNGKVLDEENQDFWIKGVAFGNEIWANKERPDLHHSEIDYQRVAEMGMNTVRFYLNYVTFEDDANPYSYKESGWKWLDDNITWAKNAGVFLILNMHAPQGGYQSQGNGGALWDDPENQRRLIALYKAIASRYKDEPVILGYDLVNEPVTTRDRDQWENLARELTREIRSVDPNHIIIVERTNAPGGNWADVDEDRNFFLVDDPNVIYTFHYYDPFDYTHQLADWLQKGEFGPYPDENKIITTGTTQWYTAIFNNPQLISGTTDWNFYEGVPYEINDEKIATARIALQAERTNSGLAYFDNFSVLEYDPNGVLTGTILEFCVEENRDVFYWSANGSGSYALANEGSCNSNSMVLSQTTADANLSLWETLFIPKQGYSYQVNGWMKGTNIPTNANIKIRLDFDESDGPVLAVNKNYLEASLLPYLEFGQRNNVPVYLGEFGLIRYCYEDNRGGVTWVSDMLDILETYNVHFTYHAYHEYSFGIYYDGNALPDPSASNQELISLFKTRLR